VGTHKVASVAVIIVALLMGLVFGGLEVASAKGNADELGRVSQLAVLGQQVTDLVQALEAERDQTAGDLPVTAGNLSLTPVPFVPTRSLESAYSTTNAAAARVESLAAGIGASFPANIRARVATVVSDISNLQGLRVEAQASQSALSVINAYTRPITDMIALDAQMWQGTSDSILISDVQTLNSLALAKDEAAQQRALLFNAFRVGQFGSDEQQALANARDGQLIDLAAFATTATPAQQSEYATDVAGTSTGQLASEIEIYVQGSGLSRGLSLVGIQPGQAAATWYADQSDTVDGMQQVELDVARNIVTRAQLLQSRAEDFALLIAILFAIILLLALIATVSFSFSEKIDAVRRLRPGSSSTAR
jgi:hypothetical protein